MATPVHSDAFVFFGMSGDLARKKIFPALYSMVKHGTLEIPVIGVASSKWTVEDLKTRAEESITEHGGGIDDKAAFEKLLELLRYVDGDYTKPSTFVKLKKELGNAQYPIHYLAIPPSMFETVVQGLGASSCAENARVVVEKPFGRDLESAQELNRVLHAVFPERADLPDRPLPRQGSHAEHPLLPLRQLVPRADLEPELRAVGADHDGRGLRRAGTRRVLRGGGLSPRRDREPPVPDGRAVGDGAAGGPRRRGAPRFQGKVFRAMQTLKPDDLVRGQFEGYRDEAGVAPDSDVETFAAVRLHIDSWRWAGVPFYVRAGKQLPVTCTEVRVELHQPPQAVFAEYEALPHETNYLRFQFDPQLVIAIGARAKKPGDGFLGEDVELYLCDTHPGEEAPYERLLDDAMSGENLLFAREDGVEASWRVVDNVLTDHDRSIVYKVHTWGPEEQNRLFDGTDVWHDPIPADPPPPPPPPR